MRRIHARAVIHGALIILSLLPSSIGLAQGIADTLVTRALTVNPRLRAAEAQAAATRARIAPAGAWMDPMLMAGLQNLPLSRGTGAGHGSAAGPEPMTMKMLGVMQTVPFPGKTSSRSTVARAQAHAADARVEALRLELTREVLDAYYELAAARAVLGLVERQQTIAASVLPAAEARYVAGTATQLDLLKVRTEAAMLVEESSAAQEHERSALARLSAVLDADDSVYIATEALPAVPAATFFLPLDSLHAIALRANPRLRGGRAMIAARAAQAELAAREHLPDFDVSIQYGQRDRLPDMISATVAVPVPIQRGRKQNALARAARLDVAAAEAQLRSEQNEVRAQITRAFAAIERQRTNLVLLDRTILPQAHAAFASTSASYQSGRGELLSVLDAMRALFATETMYVRAAAEFAKAAAELRALVGEEVVR